MLIKSMPNFLIKEKVREKGAILLVLVIFFSAISLVILLGTAAPIIRQVQMARDLESSKKSYFAAEGASEEAFYRLKNDITVSFPITSTLDGAQTNVTSTSLGPNDRLITAQGIYDNDYRTVEKAININDQVSFEYALQSGIGGISMKNNSKVYGTVYANGPITGNKSTLCRLGNQSDSCIYGGATSAGPSGNLSNVHATGTVYAHNIANSLVDIDAYYYSNATLVNTTVTGTKFPDSPDRPLVSLPISDSIIAELETDANTLATCTNGVYSISTTASIGNIKIPCDLEITGNGNTVTLTGTVWVTGNVNISGSGGTGVTVKVNDSFGNKSVAIIADDPSDRNNSSTITLGNNSNFAGANGYPTSYVMLISMNNSAEIGGANYAVNAENGAGGNLLVYASHGEIHLNNAVNLYEATGYFISLEKLAQVTYSDLIQQVRLSGSAFTWKILRWKEI
jgi:hypothetical protein